MTRTLLRIAGTALLALAISDATPAADTPPVGGSATGGQVIFDMDTLRHRPGEFAKDDKKVPAGTAELVEGKFGKAVKFTFVEGASGGFMTGYAQATPAWDAAAGLSFWVKGDGSQTWGGLELIDQNDYSLRYGYCFPIDSTQWRKIVVPWRDLVPELAGPTVGGTDGYAPGKFGALWFGKWGYWREYPAQSYTIDQVALEPTIPDDAKAGDGTTERASDVGAAGPDGLARVRAKLKARRPITIVTMGDSLTDERHWANRETVWHKLLAAKLRAAYGAEVNVVNPAIGGTTLSQNAVLMPRWGAAAPTPDLVTVWFGGNDWDAGVRGPRFAQYLRLTIDRIRRQTGGSADVLLMTTAPSFARWQTATEMEQAVRDVAKEKGTGLADVAAAFHAPGTPEEALKQDYWAWDKVHLGAKGHAATADVVMKAIEGERK